MDFVEPSVELIQEKDNFKRIEFAARTCYRSRDRITDESAYPFFQRTVKNGHTSTLEHSVIYVRTHTPEAYLWLTAIMNSYVMDTGYQHYIRVSRWDEKDDTFYTPTHRELQLPLGFCLGSEYLLSGNIRAWRKLCERYRNESIIYDTFHNHPAFADIFQVDDKSCNINDTVYTKNDIEIVDSIPENPKEYQYAYMHVPVTLKIIADRGVIDEFARHRVCGISIESSRFVNYSNGGVTFVFPYWFNDMKDDPRYDYYVGNYGTRCYETEAAYQEWVRKCKSPQMARGNLTLWTKSEGVFTATIQQWIDILALRDSPAAHPEAQKISKMIKKILVEQVGVTGVWDEPSKPNEPSGSEMFE